MSVPPLLPHPLSVTVFRASGLKYYRYAHSPRGARDSGGRFNKVGRSALYCSLEVPTAVAEYTRGGQLRPLVLTSADVVLHNVIDLTGDLTGLDEMWRSWPTDDWEAVRDQFKAGDPKATCHGWECGERAINSNCAAILFPSQQHAGGRNLAIFSEDCPVGTFSLTPYDPGREIMASSPVTL